MAADAVLDGFAAEARSLAAAMAAAPAAAFASAQPVPAVDRRRDCSRTWPTRPAGSAGCWPALSPGRATLVTAVGYYRADRRFSAATNADRIATAQRGAAGSGPDDLRAEFDRAWRAGLADAAAAPAGRRVRTRHGDLMLLTEFMRTRVLELAVHGLDLAAGLGRDPWLTDPAAAVVEELLLGGADAAAALRAQLGWDRAGLIAKATGRSPLTAAEQKAVASAGVRGLALG